VELMIAMAIVMLVLYAAINSSSCRSAVQGADEITETNVERDSWAGAFPSGLESLGFGSAVNNLVHTRRDPQMPPLHAEDSPNAPAPQFLVSDPTFTGNFNNSDYLVIKSARVA